MEKVSKKDSIKDSYKLYPLGDSALVVQFGESINLETHQKVKALATYLADHPFIGMIETIPTYTTVTIFYEPLKLYSMQKKNSFYTCSTYIFLCSIIENILRDLLTDTEKLKGYHPRKVEVPLCYGGEFGPDIVYVAEHNNLSVEEVIDIHSMGEYLVYMLGFAPGFPYLGGMSEKIATPRRQSPRLAIPAGSVGIAGLQTGVYPMETPGGWQIIGRTPATLFAPKNNPPSLLQMGDIIRFKPISPKEFANWEGE